MLPPGPKFIRSNLFLVHDIKSAILTSSGCTYILEWIGMKTLNQLAGWELMLMPFECKKSILGSDEVDNTSS